MSFGVCSRFSPNLVVCSDRNQTTCLVRPARCLHSELLPNRQTASTLEEVSNLGISKVLHFGSLLACVRYQCPLFDNRASSMYLFHFLAAAPATGTFQFGATAAVPSMNQPFVFGQAPAPAAPCKCGFELLLA